MVCCEVEGLPVADQPRGQFLFSLSFSPSFAISLWMINLCHFIAGRASWGNCQREFWVMMYSSGITGALGFLGLRVRVFGACMSRTLGIQLAFISLYSSEMLVRPGRKLLLLKGTASLFRTLVVLPVVWRRCREPPSWLKWPSNEIIKAGQTEREEAPVVQRNVVWSPNARGMLPFGALGENHSAAKLAFVHSRLLRLICGGGEKFLDTSCICDALCCAENPSKVSQCRLQGRQQFSSFVLLPMNSKVISNCVVPHYCIWSSDIDGRHWFELICGQWDETPTAEVLLCKFQGVCLT